VASSIETALPRLLRMRDRAPDAAQRSCDALLIRGPQLRSESVGPGSAVHREERCTASGTRKSE
jgi:hypothetical protein